MNQEKYPLWEKENTPFYNEAIGQEVPFLTPFLCDGKSNACVIVMPGGGYSYLAEHEGTPIAEMLQKNGISSFVLNYRVAPYQYPALIADANRAVRFVRYHADRFGIDPDKIAVLGFSAGGHLSLMAANIWDEGLGDKAQDAIDRVSCRVNACVLCYAVQTMKPSQTHMGSHDNLIGGLDNEKELEEALSVPAIISDQTPPTFLWQCFNDHAVKMITTVDTIAALTAHNIPSEIHIYPDGGHGMGLGADNHANTWGPLLCRWLKKVFA